MEISGKFIIPNFMCSRKLNAYSIISLFTRLFIIGSYVGQSNLKNHYVAGFELLTPPPLKFCQFRYAPSCPLSFFFCFVLFWFWETFVFLVLGLQFSLDGDCTTTPLLAFHPSPEMECRFLLCSPNGIHLWWYSLLRPEAWYPTTLDRISVFLTGSLPLPNLGCLSSLFWIPGSCLLFWWISWVKNRL